MTTATPFRCVLIANRGEIAARIARSVRAHGLEVAIVYHAADRGAPATQIADRTLEITGATPVAAYLDSEQILRAAKSLGADAIHPGYGFLSENAAFARRAAEENLVFIGPSPEAIELMGDKVRARRFVANHGFPVAPSAIEDDDPDSFEARTRALGPPILIKPAAGGGGKGMRIVRDLDLLAGEIDRARSEGARYFGDGRLFAERYIEKPRHIEVQVLGDRHGNILHLFERECSLQRRFQKVVEEAPSAALAPATRERICAAATGIARAAGYTNAGTVEFIYGAGEFYFLEMNTRLQVEHPVTELILGKDLVREQLRIAAGDALNYVQADISINGHAVELRIYAEDPACDFTPVTGKVLAYVEPSGDGVRIDSGIAKGQTVTASFDPLLAKLVVHAPTRHATLAKADQALREFVLLGFRTNIGFLRRLINDQAVQAGDLHTGLIDEKQQLLVEPSPNPTQARAILSAAALTLRNVRDTADAIPALHAEIGAWRN